MNLNGLFPLPDSDLDSDSDMDSCTMQDFPIGSDSDCDPLIGMYVVGTEICPWDRDLSLKLTHYPFGKGFQIWIWFSGNMFCIILSSHRVWNLNPNLNPSPAVEISHNAYLVDHGAAGGERGLWGGAGDAGAGTRGRWGRVHQAEGQVEGDVVFVAADDAQELQLQVDQRRSVR